MKQFTICSLYLLHFLVYRKQKAKIAKMSEEEKKQLDDKSLLTLEEIQDEQRKELEAFQFGDRLTGFLTN